MPNCTDFVSPPPIHRGPFSRSAMSPITDTQWRGSALGCPAEVPKQVRGGCHHENLKDHQIWNCRLDHRAIPALSIRSTQSVHAADLLVERTVGFSPIAELAVTASGAAEDTFKACVARIPAFATAGQRMLAEQSCAGEEEVRKRCEQHRNSEGRSRHIHKGRHWVPGLT